MIVTTWYLWSIIVQRFLWQPTVRKGLKDPNEEQTGKPSCSQESGNVNIEASSLEAGGPRVKFRSTWKGTLEDFFYKHPEAKQVYESLCQQMSQQLQLLEELGATPILPDGKVGGNAGALLTINNHTYTVCSKSGKFANTPMKTYQDFTIVEYFNVNDWSCEYYSASASILPTSDTPLHSTALSAYEKLDGNRKPKFLLHGHAFETEADALRLKFPISTEETLFSTREDSQALLTLMMKYMYPEYKVFIRKGHGFVLLGEDANEAWTTFEKYMKPYLSE